jgi:hypothetical protein
MRIADDFNTKREIDNFLVLNEFVAGEGEMQKYQLSN